MKAASMTTEEISQALSELSPTAVIPIGATEQHGPHLPLSVDHFLAQSVANSACELSGDISFPVVPYGYNEKEIMFEGTVSIKARTYINVLIDIGESLHKGGWRRVLFVNGHGWNNDIMRVATHVLNERDEFTAACCSYWALGIEEVISCRESQIPGGMAHAGEFETSLMMYLQPEGVRVEKRVDEMSCKISKHHHHDLFHKSPICMPERFDLLSKTGVIGQSSLASAEKGEAWFKKISSELSLFLSDYKNMYP